MMLFSLGIVGLARLVALDAGDGSAPEPKTHGGEF